MEQRKNWAVVLAGGDGARLRELTRGADGVAVPKQYCSLRGGGSLLAEALERARGVAAPERILVVVAADHARWWEPELAALPRGNVLAQPANRGTATGVLLALVAVLRRDPSAVVTLLPADHHVLDEGALGRALHRSSHAARGADAAVLLGFAPDAPESGYGWIVPRPGLRVVREVERFVEKPLAAVARELHDLGGLWNGMLVTARASVLAGLYRKRAPRLLARLAAARTPADLEEVYPALEALDFSRHVLEGSEPHLRVLEVPPCGWTDLGTPERVALRLRELQPAPLPRGAPPSLVLEGRLSRQPA